ncbi:hypothetical protein ALT721_1260010 [Alteromonas alvinellae]
MTLNVIFVFVIANYYSVNKPALRLAPIDLTVRFAIKSNADLHWCY